MPLLKDLTNSSETFFSILPQDWADGIVPYWAEYNDSAKVYCVLEDDKVVAGGIVFSTVSPDTKGYAEIAQSWFDKGYLYIAFLYVSPEQRGRGLGSFWFKELKKLKPNQHYWLAIEEHALSGFYAPLGFEERELVMNNGTQEWILAEPINQ